MFTNQFWKGLFMAVVAVIVSSLSTTPIDFLMVGVTAVCAILTYVGKNLIDALHSDSPAGSLTLINAISGILVALGTGLLTGVSQFLIDGTIAWPVLGKIVLSITLTYLGATFFSGPYSIKKVEVLGKS